MKKHKIKLLVSMLVILVVTGCSNSSSKVYEKTAYMLGTICTIKVYDSISEDKAKDAVDKAFLRVKAIEDKMSVNKAGTELDAVAAAAGTVPTKVSADTFFVVKKGLDYCAKSNGMFDITVGPLVKLWGIGTDNARVPTTGEINEKKALINFHDVILDEKNSTILLKRKDMSFDLGGIAKGYSADEAARILKENGIKHAIINLGGNVLALDQNPSGIPWQIGVQNPLDVRGAYLGILDIKNKTVVTSGINERFFEKDGKRYHHILNPFTGFPMDNSLASVTVITDVSVDADAMTKYIFSLGLQKGPEYFKTLKNTEVILVTKNKEVYITEGLKNTFKLTNTDFKIVNK